jgi:hypothetical protein
VNNFLKVVIHPDTILSPFRMVIATGRLVVVEYNSTSESDSVSLSTAYFVLYVIEVCSRILFGQFLLILCRSKA